MSIQQYKQALEKAVKPAGYWHNITINGVEMWVDMDIYSTESSDLYVQLIDSGHSKTLLNKVVDRVILKFLCNGNV